MRRTILGPVAVILLSVAFSRGRALAQEGGALYVGGNYAYALTTYDRSALNSALVSAVNAADLGLALHASYVDSKQTAWSADIGYMVSRYFSVEASYLDLGTLRYFARGTESSLFASAPFATRVDISSRGPTLALVGVLPMTNDWYLNARVGAYESKTESGVRTVVGGSVLAGSYSESSADPLAGVGTAYVLGAHWVFRLDYVYLNQIKEKLLGKPFNVNLVTAGLAYAF